MSNDTRGSEPETTTPDATSDSATASASSPTPGTVDTAKRPATDKPSDAAAEERALESTADGSSDSDSEQTPTVEGTSTAGDNAQGPTVESASAADDNAREPGADSADSESADASGAATSADDPVERRSPALIATAVALPIALVVGVLVMGVLANRHPAREPLVVGAVQAPAASGPECSALLPALPEKIGDYTTSELVQPAPAGAKAWQKPEGGDAIVLRCGLERPLEFNRASPLQVVNNVNWFDVRDPTSGVASGTWWAVDRGTYIALTMPDNAGPTPLQDISDAISKAIPQQPLDPGPLPN